MFRPLGVLLSASAPKQLRQCIAGIDRKLVVYLSAVLVTLLPAFVYSLAFDVYEFLSVHSSPLIDKELDVPTEGFFIHNPGVIWNRVVHFNLDIDFALHGWRANNTLLHEFVYEFTIFGIHDPILLAIMLR
jgi:hypothetical protein